MVVFPFVDLCCFILFHIVKEEQSFRYLILGTRLHPYLGILDVVWWFWLAEGVQRYKSKLLFHSLQVSTNDSVKTDSSSSTFSLIWFSFCLFCYPVYSMRPDLCLSGTSVGCANGGGPTMYGLRRRAAGMEVCL